MKKAEKILRFIAASRTGRTFHEIQVFIIRMNFNRKWTYADRGYYCTNLTGCHYTAPGILLKYCRRVGPKVGGRWVIRKRIVGPFYKGTAADPQHYRDLPSSR